MPNRRDFLGHMAVATAALCPVQALAERRTGVSSPPKPAGETKSPSLLPHSEKEAIAIATSRIGLRNVDPKAVVVRNVMLTKQCLPFFPDELRGRTAWVVEFTNLDLAKASGNASLTNAFVKNLIATLCPETGEVMRVVSTWPNGVPRRAEHPSAAEEERQLKASSHTYVGFPKEKPNITLCDAIAKSVPWGDDVKQICACYVDRVWMNHAPESVWVVYLRGHGAMPFSIPYGFKDLKVEIPEDAGNHLRNVVDAKTGKWLFADTIPQPVVPLEQRF
jgi:hypothetical protein